MRESRCFISREKQVLLVGFSVEFPIFPRISKNWPNISLMSLVFFTSRSVSFNDSNRILKYFNEGFENLSSSFFLIPKICYQIFSSPRGCVYTSRSGSFIWTFATRWQMIMVLLFHMKQIFILVRTVFVELIYLSGDLKTINYWSNLSGYYLK